MGFCTSVNEQKNFFDKETYTYLLGKKELLGEVYKLLLSFQNPSTPGLLPQRFLVEITNNWGERARLNLIGINTTSLISSEMKGSVTFTFLKDVSEIKKVDTNLMSHGRKLSLVKK